MAGNSISGTINNTVTIGSSTYPSPLYITSSGGVLPGGTNGTVAIYAPASSAGASLTNAGTIGGGSGPFGVFGGFDGGNASDGGTGGYGVDLQGTASVTNFGFIAGGGGGAGGNGGYGAGYPGLSVQSPPGDGGKGGAGGLGNSGINLAAPGTIANNGTIVGGYGGAGGQGGKGGSGDYNATYQIKHPGGYTPGLAGVGGGSGASGGDAGVGGTGVFLLAGSVTNSVQIIGGAGGAGGDGGDGGNGAFGFDGGPHPPAYQQMGGTGGDGGDGGDGADGGNGVIGGIGVDLAASTSLSNTGTIFGGAGGNGGNGGAGGGGGTGGYGGAGGYFGNGTPGFGGGNGGGGGDGGNGGNAGNGGVGGVGVDVNRNASLTNYGMIAGGAGGNGGTGGAYGAYGLYGHGGRPFQSPLSGNFYGPFGADGSNGYDGSNGSDGADVIGGPGVYIDGGIVTNFGTIEAGAGGYSVLFGPTGGTLAIAPGAVFIGNVVGNSSGADVVELGTSGASGGTINLGGQFSGLSNLNFTTGTSLTVEGDVSVLASNTPISGFAPGDTIILDGFVATSDTYVSGTGLVLGNGSSTVTLNLTGDFTTTDFVVTDPPGDTTITLNEATPCYCRGTLILTPKGETPVEDLAAGDFVVTSKGVHKRLCWIGVGRVMVARGRRSVATPIIIRKGALAENVPHSDLRITKGHSLYLDRVLVPAEFLVNHRSILWDDHVQEVTVFHLELEDHDVLLANGAPAESYRDDGNRWLFRNANTGWHLPPKSPCAPVLTGGPIVDAIWRRLLGRAGPRPGLPVVNDPDVHLLVDGNRIDPTARMGDEFVFRLPSGPSSVRIRSREGVPAELGLARDPRSLGVAVKRVQVRQGRHLMQIEADDERLVDGFHGYESEDRLRWTNGDAGLPPALFSEFSGSTELVMLVAGGMPYPLLTAPLERFVA